MAIINQHDAFKKKTGMKKLPVNNSGWVSAFQYDTETEQLTVVLKSGGEYVYSDVDASTFDQLTIAPSKGQFYAKYIKGKFESLRLIDKTVGPEEGKHGSSRDDRNTGPRKNRRTKDLRGTIKRSHDR
jgi:hypothetical protein